MISSRSGSVVTASIESPAGETAWNDPRRMASFLRLVLDKFIRTAPRVSQSPFSTPKHTPGWLSVPPCSPASRPLRVACGDGLRPALTQLRAEAKEPWPGWRDGARPKREAPTRWAWAVICPRQTGPFLARVFRADRPWLGGAERHEGIEVFGCAEDVYFEARGLRDPSGGHLPQGGD